MSTIAELPTTFKTRHSDTDAYCQRLNFIVDSVITYTLVLSANCEGAWHRLTVSYATSVNIFADFTINMRQHNASKGETK